MNTIPHKISPGSALAIEIIKRELKPADRKAFTADDALFMLEWPILKFAAAAISEHRWADVAMKVERMKLLVGQPSPAKAARAIQQTLALRSLKDAEAIAWRVAAGRTEQYIQVLKVRSPGGWWPTICLEGEDHLKTGLARGKGVILWAAHFCFNTLVTKMALKAAGYRVSHVSRPEHGFSKSRFGIRFLNPLRCNAELNYLDERIIIDRGQPGGALRSAKAVLDDNRIVSITAGAWEGHRVARGPLHNSLCTLATGAPDLAHRTGAALLPVVTTRMAASEAFRVRIGKPLATASKDNLEVVRTAAAGFLSELETSILEAPEQWRGWRYLEFVK